MNVYLESSVAASKQQRERGRERDRERKRSIGARKLTLRQRQNLINITAGSCRICAGKQYKKIASYL